MKQRPQGPRTARSQKPVKHRTRSVGQSDGVRNTLIKRGLIRKEKDGSGMRYYLV
jgi:hypothetical protein